MHQTVNFKCFCGNKRGRERHRNVHQVVCMHKSTDEASQEKVLQTERAPLKNGLIRAWCISRCTFLGGNLIHNMFHYFLAVQPTHSVNFASSIVIWVRVLRLRLPLKSFFFLLCLTSTRWSPKIFFFIRLSKNCGLWCNKIPQLPLYGHELSFVSEANFRRKE